eukprot:656450-Prymnesium_polylepis.1
MEGTTSALRLEALETKLAELQASTDARTEELADSADTAWIIVQGSFVVLMQLGFAQLEAGTVREHNVIATYAKNMLDFIVGTVAALAIGYFIAYDVHALLPVDDGGPKPDAFFSYLCFQGTAATIVSGAMAERTGIVAYIVISAMLSCVQYALAVRMTWAGGFLSQRQPPFHDFAGAGIVHLLGGVAALAGAAAVGPRNRRWVLSAAHFSPHNIPSVICGTILLWVGWYGFNTGSTGGSESERGIKPLLSHRAAHNTWKSEPMLRCDSVYSRGPACRGECGHGDDHLRSLREHDGRLRLAHQIAVDDRHPGGEQRAARRSGGHHGGLRRHRLS